MDMISPVADNQSTAPWHGGEVALQQRVGVAERMRELGTRVVRKFMPDQHRAFFAQLPFVVLGAVDDAGDVWATLLAGQPGFMQSPGPQALDVAALPDPRDPAYPGVHDGAAVGLLGIELHTRRRNRMNGTVRGRTARGFSIGVDESFGNCPQYIQLRSFEFVREPAQLAEAAPQYRSALNARDRAIIEAADTFFVASYVDRDGAGRQVDVSHRGGNAGFVRIGADGVLTVPDFAGNLFFSTLGNFLVNPRAGLVFVDFASGDVLQLSGTATVDLDSPEIAAFQGAERLWRFTPQRVVYRAGALPLRWTFREDGWSVNSLMTGNWREAASRLKASELANAWRPFRVTQIVDESATIRSFHLEPMDGAGLVPHQAGQYLPIRVTLAEGAAASDGVVGDGVVGDGVVGDGAIDRSAAGDGVVADGATDILAVAAAATTDGVAVNSAAADPAHRTAPAQASGTVVRRTYTLSSGPADSTYRISVKREGRVSRHLHDTLRVGSVLEARAPAGRFTLDAHERRPAVLLAAGVGITPMMAMLRDIVYEGMRTRRMRPTWLFQAARTLGERAFGEELDYLEQVSGGAINVVRALSDPRGAQANKDYDHEGRIDIALLRETLPFDDYDFYLCGPAAFMQSLYDGLRDLNIADERIHAEAFGPASMQRRRAEQPAKAAGASAAASAGAGADSAANAAPARAAADQPTPVIFAKSAKEARWTPGSGSLLELAEARGLAPEFSCRAGSCGSCRTRIVEGVVSYANQPEFETAGNEALICCSVPAKQEDGSVKPLVLDL
ncbi:MAG TPA: pyridoxamine 5'-phosphate oxidase family protein [Paraburkholderia sp.]|nr:pyridoxamine 5'-phosphate oxidase family protein [Paraburkholderia sp.]